MSEFNIKTNCRIEELIEEDQLVIVRLVNHLASHNDIYREHAMDRIKKISEENPYCDDIEGFKKLTMEWDDEDFEEDEYMKMEKARYGVGMTEKEIEEELKFDEEITKKLKEIN